MEKEIAILVLLLLLSAFFSASETALVSLSPARVRALLERKKPGAKLVAYLKSRPHKLLITILVGNNLVNIFTSVYATVVFENILGSKVLGVVTGVLTLIILVFGEIVPKSFAQAHAKTLSHFFAFPLYFFMIVFTPVVWVLDLLVKSLLKLSSKERSEHHVTEEELKAFVSIGAEEGVIERDEQELIENVLEFSDTRVEEIMIPRVDIKALPDTATAREAADFFAEHHFSRIPVYHESVDDIIGLITMKGVFYSVRESRLNVPLAELDLLMPLKVPGSKRINQLFHEFQKRRIHMAIVLDEHGGTAGLITMEDLLEEIVGEIVDEHDQETPESIIKVGTLEVQATGKALIEEVNDALAIRIPCPEHRTLSYFITEKLGRFPKQGEIIEGNGFTITVEEMFKHTIQRITVVKGSK